MKKILLILVVSLMISSCENKEVNKNVNVNSSVEVNALAITCDNTKEKINEGAILIDVRSKEEYNLNHLDGALNISVDDIKDEISKVVKDKNQVIILYCQSGNRSSQAADILIDLGYTKVYDLGSINNCEE